jgi:hypothetical protein
MCRQSMREMTKSYFNTGMVPHRILIHSFRSNHRVLAAGEVFFGVDRQSGERYTAVRIFSIFAKYVALDSVLAQ